MQRITIQARLDGYTGYGLHLIELHRWLTNRGYYVSIRPIRTVDGRFGAGIPTEVMASVVNGPQPEAWEILLATCDHLPTPGKNTIYFTMWESTDLPGRNVDMLNLAKAIVVPCQWNKEVFERRGVKPPIFVVPLGHDPEIFFQRMSPPSGITLFSAAGRTAHGRTRKGLDSVFRAFKAAFPYDKKVMLQVKCHADCQIPDHYQDDRIIVHRHHWGAEQIAKWLAQSHCFVSGATSEGWGLWQHQAMAVGRPVIAAHYGGLREFMGIENSYALPYREADACEGFCGKWAIPDLEAMVSNMRRVHERRDEARAKGLAAALTMENFTWRRSTDELIKVCGLMGMLPKQDPVHSVFFVPKLLHVSRRLEIPHPLEQCKDMRWPAVEFNFQDKGEREAIFNPSLALNNGPIWFARSSIKSPGGDRQKSSIFAFKDSGDIVAERIPINIPGRGNDDFEDPRAVAFHGGIALSYTRVPFQGAPCQEIAFLDQDLNVQSVWHPNIGKNGMTPKEARGPEKNWVWFLDDCNWNVIHWLEPMQIHRVVDGAPTDSFESNKFNPRWKYGVRHGGAHPTLVGDEWFGFCHSLMPWFGRDRSRYFISAYAFSAKPPYEMTRMARAPLLRSSDDLTCNPCSCVIAGGAFFNGQTWTMAVGSRDEECLKIEIPHNDVLATMDTV